MVGKQPRVPKSSNAADIGVLKVRPSVSSTTPNISSDESKSCQCLLKVSSPPPRPDDTEAYEGFLERCHNCHRKLELHQDLFMYSSTAFCTAECRLAQMERDSAALERAKPARKTCINTRH